MPVEEVSREMPVALAQQEDADALRAQMYRFLARLLAAPPDKALLKTIAGLQGDETDLGKAMLSLGKLAAKTNSVGASLSSGLLDAGARRRLVTSNAGFDESQLLRRRSLH